MIHDGPFLTPSTHTSPTTKKPPLLTFGIESLSLRYFEKRIKPIFTRANLIDIVSGGKQLENLSFKENAVLDNVCVVISQRCMQRIGCYLRVWIVATLASTRLATGLCTFYNLEIVWVKVG